MSTVPSLSWIDKTAYLANLNLASAGVSNFLAQATQNVDLAGPDRSSSGYSSTDIADTRPGAIDQGLNIENVEFA